MILRGNQPRPHRDGLDGEIHVWTARPEEFRDAAVALARCRGWLSDDERARADRYLRADDGHLFTIAHALLRFALSHYADVPPEGWIFATEEHGRPRVAAPLPRIGFSLTHTPGLVACLVSEEIDCGIDAEAFGRVSDPRGLAKRYFSKQENEALDLVPDDELDERFVELWTLKEAYVKARGLGLEIPLDRFHFPRPKGDAIAIAFDSAIEDSSDAWNFTLDRLAPGHALATGVRRGTCERRRTLHRVVSGSDSSADL